MFTSLIGPTPLFLPYITSLETSINNLVLIKLNDSKQGEYKNFILRSNRSFHSEYVECVRYIICENTYLCYVVLNFLFFHWHYFSSSDWTINSLNPPKNIFIIFDQSQGSQKSASVSVHILYLVGVL